MAKWLCTLALNEKRDVVAGSYKALSTAVCQAADVRAYTTFDYGEHMASPGSETGLIQEMMDFPVTYCLEGNRVTGIQTTRYPADCSHGFQSCPSLSFFMYNDNGQFGIARPYLDGRNGKTEFGDAASLGSKYRVLERFDENTSCPSENAIYQFGEYKWWVRDDWEEVLSHEADGSVVNGSLESLQAAFRSGKEFKVGVKNLCGALSPKGKEAVDHEVFVGMGPIYNHQDQGFLGGESHPIVRVAPSVPMEYRSGNWNYGWILPRTDGVVHQLIIDPYTHAFNRTECRCAVRWFVR